MSHPVPHLVVAPIVLPLLTSALLVLLGERRRRMQSLINVCATLPANYFQANGSGLVSVIGEGQIKQIADQQDEAE